MNDKVPSRMIIVILLVFAAVCGGLLISILDNMHQEADFIAQNLSDNRIEYNIWLPSDIDEKIVQSMYTSYDEKKLGIKFNITTFSADVYEDKLIASGITNKLPDMFYIDDERDLRRLVDIGSIMDLSDYIDAKNLKKDFLAEALEDFTVNHRIYGLPLMGWEEVLYCNTAIFEACGIDYPESYDEFLQCIKAFKAQGIIPLSLGGESFKNSELYYRMLVEENGELEESARKIEELVQLEPFPIGYIAMRQEEAAERFANGESAMFLGTSQQASILEDAASSQVKGKIKVMSCPVENEEERRIGSFACGFVLNQNSQINKEEKIRDYYESFERRLSWEMVIHRGQGLPVYEAQRIEKTRFKLLSACYELMSASDNAGVYEHLLEKYKLQKAQYELQILRLMQGQIDAESFLSALRL